MSDPSQYVLVAIFNELQHHGGPIALSTARSSLPAGGEHGRHEGQVWRRQAFAAPAASQDAWCSRRGAQRRFPRRRPPCPCCKFTSSTAISTELAINAWWISLHVPPWYPPRYCQTLRHRYQTVFEQRLSAGIRVTSHHGILHDFHHQLLHPAPLMNSPSSSTCSHLLLVTSSHLDFPGGVMNRLSSPVGVLAP